jgi:hypothetical protein
MKRSNSLGLAFLAVAVCAWSLPSLAQSTGNATRGQKYYGPTGYACNQCHANDPRNDTHTAGGLPILMRAAPRDPNYIDYAMHQQPEVASIIAAIESQSNYMQILGDLAEYLYACKITPVGKPCDLTEGSAGGGGGGGTNYGGLWWVPAESGWGVNFSHQGNLIYATWYTYDTSGKAWWLSMLATQQGTSQTFTGNILASQGVGLNVASAAAPSQIGTGSITFSDGSNGSFTYTLNGFGTQSKSVTKFKYGAVPTCTYSASPNFTSAGNYQDLWWVPSESGWGMNVTQQGSQIYVTWYSYDVDGSPLWLSVLAPQGANGTFTGTLNRTSGTTWNNFDPTAVTPKAVGTASFTFPDGNHMNMTATVQVSGMATSTTFNKQLTRFLFAAPAGTLCN